MGLFRRKHKNTKQLEAFFKKGFKKEIRTLMECRSLLEAEEKWYEKFMDASFNCTFKIVLQSLSSYSLSHSGCVKSSHASTLLYHF